MALSPILDINFETSVCPTMSPLSPSDSRSQPSQTSVPIALMLPGDLLQGKTTSYQCEVIIPITLKLPIILEIEVSTRLPQCHTSKSQPAYSTSHAIAATSSSNVSPEDSPIDSQSLELRPVELHTDQPQPLVTEISTETDQPQKQQSLAAWLQRRHLGWLLNQILRYLRPNTTVTMIVLGAFLGTACSSVVVMQRLQSQAESGTSLELLAQPGLTQSQHSLLGLE